MSWTVLTPSPMAPSNGSSSWSSTSRSPHLLGVMNLALFLFFSFSQLLEVSRTEWSLPELTVPAPGTEELVDSAVSETIILCHATDCLCVLKVMVESTKLSLPHLSRYSIACNYACI